MSRHPNLAAKMPLFALLLVPLAASSQSYEWFDYAETTPGQDPTGEYSTDLFQVEPSDYGTYSIGRMDCDYPQCYGLLSKYDNENGSLEWRRRFTIYERTEPFTLTVNDAGIFVAGRTSEGGVTPGASRNGGFVRRYSHDGDALWTKRDSRTLLDALDMVSDGDSVYVVGIKWGDGRRAVVRRMSFGGTELWTRVMSVTSDSALHVEVADGRLYVLTGDKEIKIIRASDGAWLGSFPLTTESFPQGMSYHGNYLYVIDYRNLVKYNLEGDEIWRHTFWRDTGPTNLSSITTSDNGIYLTGTFRTPYDADKAVRTGTAVILVGSDGTINNVVEYPGDMTRPRHLSIKNDKLYVTGGVGRNASYTARYSFKALARPSVLALAGAGPAMPPRIAVLRHDLGAGPVRVGIRDAAPGSVEYLTEFSEGLKPVAFEKVRDLDDNGYEEMVVVSRLPALVEVRDSWEGNLVSTIKLGTRFEPIAATVEQRAGTPPRLAVAVRHKMKDKPLLRIYDLTNGELLASHPYHPGFDTVDVAALPDVDGSGAHRYALLARNRTLGAPHKVEVRDGNGNLLNNLWLGSDLEPLQLSAEGADAISVLRYGAATATLDVAKIDLATGDRVILEFGRRLAPVAMLPLADKDGNDSPPYTVYSEETSGASVKAETRDLATGALVHNVFTGKYYRPQSAAHVGPVPGFSDDAFALLGFRHENGEFRVSLVDVDGTKLFALEFFAEP